MLFSDPIFFLVFLPISFFLYRLTLKLATVSASRILLVAASLFFYGYWEPRYLPLLVLSICFNYSLALAIGEFRNGRGRWAALPRLLLAIGIAGDIAFLGYYKYWDFLIENVNYVLDASIQPLNLLLPLAISFFTFQQIAFLVDVYSGKARLQNFLSYALFVSFFPQLIAGPIVHHKEMMPQFTGDRLKNSGNTWLSGGIFIFCIGLSKKLFLADNLADAANSGYADVGALGFVESWITSLSYTFQLYFDFSGYSDMAIGAGLIFGIRLPQNFNSPYLARSIQEFWRRWHITLSHWLRDYIYKPLGGSRVSESSIYLNLAITFLIGGIWHGAGWTFVIWGALHGLATIAHRIWMSFRRPMPTLVAWLVTFIFIHFTWIFFRAESLDDAVTLIHVMSGSNVASTKPLEVAQNHLLSMLLIMIAFLISLLPWNSNALVDTSLPKRAWVGFTCGLVMFLAVIVQINAPNSEFLYFNF
jgi:D-alanyl-lipoteichoic acid acyltransferase DltB (MBOAT superfamily)